MFPKSRQVTDVDASHPPLCDVFDSGKAVLKGGWNYGNKAYGTQVRQQSAEYFLYNYSPAGAKPHKSEILGNKHPQT